MILKRNREANFHSIKLFAANRAGTDAAMTTAI
jgi:hypothetical protein